MQSIQFVDLDRFKPLLLLIARISLLVLFILFGIPKLLHFTQTTSLFASKALPFPSIAALIAVIFEVPVAIALAAGFYTRPLALALLFYTLATAILGHPYWSLNGPTVASNMINFYKNISIAGGFLLLAVTGPGTISLDRR